MMRRKREGNERGGKENKRRRKRPSKMKGKGREESRVKYMYGI